MNFAIIGATGNVGRKIIEVLEKSNLEIDNLFIVASEKSAGQKLVFRKKEIIVEQLEKYDFSKAEISIFDFSNTSIVFLPTLPVAPIIAKFILFNYFISILR